MKRGVVAWVSLMLVLVPSAAWSAEHDLQVSSDGESWRDELTSPLFGRDARWVPGDVAVRSFFVRNRARSAGVMSLSLDVLDDVDGLFAEEDFVLEARSKGATWQRLRRSANSYRLTAEPIVGGDQVRVDVRVAFDPRSTNQSMGQSLRANFIVTLTEATPDAQPGTRSDASGVLPATGSGARAWWAWLGAALIGFGAAVVAGSRRLEEKRSHV